jgi:hypothetical protein
LSMLPEFKLLATDVEGTFLNFTQQDVVLSKFELSLYKTHWSTSITTPSRLVKHQKAVFGLKLSDKLCGCFRTKHPQAWICGLDWLDWLDWRWHHGVVQKNPSGF